MALNKITMKTFWLTGLPGAGKSTIAAFMQKKIKEKQPVIWLDGDAVRTGLCKGLGFSDADRSENIRRVAEVAKILNTQNIFVICSFVSPNEQLRALARDIVGEAYREIWVTTPLSECAKRDPKGMYAQAQKGEIQGFTGISAPYQEPKNAEYKIDGYGPWDKTMVEIVSILEKEN